MNITPSCILLDIEGTTTPIDFVCQVLFPFARTQMKDYLVRHWFDAEVRDDLVRLRAEHEADAQQSLAPPSINDNGPTSQIESTTAYLHWLMDRDRKSTPLKSLQGKIWEEGYRAGQLLSQIFDDVPPAMKRWHEPGKRICIYSSGSVLAQKLLFSHTTAGDLTPLISDYFDTLVGAKIEADSYRRIAAQLQLLPEEIIFVSDVVAELDAAHGTGLQTVLSLRPGNRLQPPSGLHKTIQSFAEMF